MEATIKAERLDAHADRGNNPVNAVIENPIGDFPAEAFHAANEEVQARYDVTDFAGDGDAFVVGTVEYEGGEFTINLN